MGITAAMRTVATRTHVCMMIDLLHGYGTQ